jgi:hypothetical protein
MKTSVILFFSLVSLSLCIPCSLFAQENTDTSTIWRVETSDGNEYYGTLLSKDAKEIRIRTEVLGVISIPLTKVASMGPVDKAAVKEGEVWLKNIQSARYFYGPNGYGLEKGSGYYQNTWVLFNQASYGVTNYFSIGVGMVPLFLFAGTATPVWITPKLSVPVVKEKFNVGCGAMLGGLIGESSGLFGITYAVLTIGNRDANFTTGLGYAFADGEWATQPLVNFSGMARVTKKAYILTENYWFSADGENIFLIFIGGRTIWQKISLDYGLVLPTPTEEFIAIPWLGVTIPFGRMP